MPWNYLWNVKRNKMLAILFNYIRITNICISYLIRISMKYYSCIEMCLTLSHKTRIQFFVYGAFMIIQLWFGLHFTAILPFTIKRKESKTSEPIKYGTSKYKLASLEFGTSGTYFCVCLFSTKKANCNVYDNETHYK